MCSLLDSVVNKDTKFRVIKIIRRMQIKCFGNAKKGELASFLALVVRLYEQGRTLELILERFIGLQ